MNLWLKYFDEVEVVGALIRKKGEDKEVRGKEKNELCYDHCNLKFTPIPSFNLLNFNNALKAAIRLPYIFFKIINAMHRADHLHLRCPGNVGLIACLCQIFFPSKPKTVKYAGNWAPQAKQPWTYKFQKWILSNTFFSRNVRVLVYGKWPEQTKNVVPFFTASFSEKDISSIEEKDFSGPFTFLFVGNLVPGKKPLESVKLVERINFGTDQEVSVNLEIYGEGPERKKLETYVKEKQLGQLITLKGNRPLEELKGAYQKAHFVILPSCSEGWPKAIAEGMFFGCIPIATPVSCVPWMLANGSRGILLGENQEIRFKNQEGKKGWSVDSGQGAEDLKKISQLIDNPEKMKRMSEAAKEWSQQYTLERFEEAIKEVLYKEQQTPNHKQKSASPTVNR
ncbi:glycosyltransferase [Salinimicrobium catena]|uniref:glycosyltransferase family 4 protein n=1 Tax=Salinimicrobium catena TaxID=390640 RepID=UPI002FE43549